MFQLLIVDDDDITRRLLATRLAPMGCDVFEAETGEAALTALELRPIDVVLLDQIMPHMEGLQVFEMMRERWPGLPAIMMTAHGSIPLATKFMQLGGADFVEKPIDIEVLHVKIMRAIRNSETAKKLEHCEAARQNTEKELREQEKLLIQSAKLAAIGTLAGGIAHDFNNILLGILGYTELIRDDLPEDSPNRRYAEEVLKAGKRAKELIQQILTFSRNVEQRRKPVYLLPIVKEVLSLLRATLPADIEIRERIDAQDGCVLADATQIHQLVMNLGTNAAQAMRETGGVLEVRLDAVDLAPYYARTSLNLEGGTYVRISVTDTGHGMDAKTMERIFDPYYTTKAVGEGAGMGLSVAHGIVLSHGGAISVYSEPGKGATFHVYLPRYEKGDSSKTAEPAPLPRGAERILFVDDEPVVISLGREMIGRLGYEVTTCADGLEALETFHAKPDYFDLVITDQAMPKMTGKELAEALMKIRPGIPIVLTTGFSETVTPARASELGVREYVMKPFATREIAEVIRRALDKP